MNSKTIKAHIVSDSAGIYTSVRYDFRRDVFVCDCGCAMRPVDYAADTVSCESGAHLDKMLTADEIEWASELRAEYLVAVVKLNEAQIASARFEIVSALSVRRVSWLTQLFSFAS